MQARRVPLAAVHTHGSSAPGCSIRGACTSMRLCQHVLSCCPAPWPVGGSSSERLALLVVPALLPVPYPGIAPAAQKMRCFTPASSPKKLVSLVAHGWKPLATGTRCRRSLMALYRAARWALFAGQVGRLCGRLGAILGLQGLHQVDVCLHRLLLALPLLLVPRIPLGLPCNGGSGGGRGQMGTGLGWGLGTLAMRGRMHHDTAVLAREAAAGKGQQQRVGSNGAAACWYHPWAQRCLAGLQEQPRGRQARQPISP